MHPEVVVAAASFARIGAAASNPLLMMAHHEDGLRRLRGKGIEPVGLPSGEVAGGCAGDRGVEQRDGDARQFDAMVACIV